ncbi:MAG: MFS transporter [Chlorobi bacterium]|nr:MFS transporter [Chlorobiota bacterium]
MNIDKNKEKFQFGNVLSISIAHFVHDVYTSFLAPILPLIIDKLSLTYSMVSFLKVVQSIPSLVNPFIGLLADRLRLRYLIIVTPFITTVAMSLVGIAPSYIVLLVILFVVGISSTFFHVPTPVLVRKVSGSQIGKGMSFFMVGGEIARTIGPIIITAAVSLWGLEGTYRLIPFGFLTTIYLYYKFRNISVSKSTTKENGAWQTVRKLVPFFAIVSGIMFFRASMKSAMTFFLPTYLTSAGDTEWIATIALSVIQLSGTTGTFFAGTISDKIGRKTSLMLITAITPFLMWLFIFVPTEFKFPVLIIMGFFMFASTPVLLAMVNEHKTDRPAFINSIYMAINFAIGSIGVMVVGFLGDKYGFDLTYKITAFLAFGSFPFTLFLKNSK